MASKTLSKAQENAIGYLHRNGERQFKMFYEGSDVKPYQKLVELGLATTKRAHTEYIRGYDVYTLTPLGEAKAASLFADDSSTPETIASEPAPVADTEIPFAAGIDDTEPATLLTDAVLAEMRGAANERMATLYAEDYAATVQAELLAEWAERDSLDSDSLPSDLQHTPDSAVLEDVQLSSTVKAKNTPPMTKKQRKQQKQAAIRAQYAMAQEQKRILREQGLAAVFENARRIVAINSQMTAVGKAA